MKILIVSLLLALLPVGLAQASTTMFPAHSGHNDAPVLIVYSSLDEPLAKPMIAGFQAANPDVAVRYEDMRSEEHTSELQSLMRISYAVFCLKKKNKHTSSD